MKITKTFISVFGLTFLIGLTAIFLFKNSFVPTRSANQTAEKVSVEMPKAVIDNEEEAEKLNKEEAEKSDVIYYETAKNFGGAKILDSDYWGEEEETKYKFEMLETREFHGDEVDAKSGEKWLGLFRENDKFVLRREKITVRRVRDGIVDGRNSKEKTGKSVSVRGKIEPLFLLKNADKFGEGQIETLFRGAVFEEADSVENPITELKNGFVQTYKIGGKNYVLRVERVFNKNLEILFALILESEQTRQILHVSSDDYLGTLYWVGDFDRDKKPDFFLSPWIKENVSESSLFLSSEAEKNNLVKKVALMGTVGC